jgi:error-prone DNA polymerase
MQVLIAGRNKIYTSINELRDLGLSDAVLERLADADAFRSIGLDRREALWEVTTKDHPVALFTGQPAGDPEEKNIQLPVMTLSEHVVHDYASVSLSLRAHPVSFVREKLNQLHIVDTKSLSSIKDGENVKVAGLVLVRQRPGTAKGVCFITLEDESGCANLVVFANLFTKFKKEILQARLLMVEGKLQRQDEVIHVIVSKAYDLTKLLRHLTTAENTDLPVLTLARADEKSIPAHAQKKLFGESRNFR